MYIFHIVMFSYFITQRLEADVGVELGLPGYHADKSCYST